MHGTRPILFPLNVSEEVHAVKTLGVGFFSLCFEDQTDVASPHPAALAYLSAGGLSSDTDTDPVYVHG